MLVNIAFKVLRVNRKTVGVVSLGALRATRPIDLPAKLNVASCIGVEGTTIVSLRPKFKLPVEL